MEGAGQVGGEQAGERAVGGASGGVSDDVDRVRRGKCRARARGIVLCGPLGACGACWPAAGRGGREAGRRSRPSASRSGEHSRGGDANSLARTCIALFPRERPPDRRSRQPASRPPHPAACVGELASACRSAGRREWAANGRMDEWANGRMGGGSAAGHMGRAATMSASGPRAAGFAPAGARAGKPSRRVDAWAGRGFQRAGAPQPVQSRARTSSRSSSARRSGVPTSIQRPAWCRPPTLPAFIAARSRGASLAGVLSARSVNRAGW